MRPAESRNTIKKMQDFMDGLDDNVLNKKILGSNIKVRHIAAAVLSVSMLRGFGKVENAETSGQIYAGGTQALLSMAGAFGMINEENTGGPDGSRRTTLNAMVASATHFMVAQVENGQKLYDENGKYTGTVVNRYDRDGKITASVPVYQIREGLKNQARKISQAFMNAKRQNG